MRCPSCHHDNRSDRRFCTQCGTRLAGGCASCGAPVEVGEKFCGGCGAALTIGRRTTTPSPAHTSVLAEKIRQAKATVEGERKQVTVLFADVTGSMELAEQLDPEAWSQIMQRFFRIFCDGAGGGGVPVPGGALSTARVLLQAPAHPEGHAALATARAACAGAPRGGASARGGGGNLDERAAEIAQHWGRGGGCGHRGVPGDA